MPVGCQGLKDRTTETRTGQNDHITELPQGYCGDPLVPFPIHNQYAPVDLYSWLWTWQLVKLLHTPKLKSRPNKGPAKTTALSKRGLGFRVTASMCILGECATFPPRIQPLVALVHQKLPHTCPMCKKNEKRTKQKQRKEHGKQHLICGLKYLSPTSF